VLAKIIAMSPDGFPYGSKFPFGSGFALRENNPRRMVPGAGGKVLAAVPDDEWASGVQTL